MKFYLTLSAFIFAVSCFGQQASSHSSGFDSALAKKLGADEYGMKQYVMAFLKRGTEINDTAERRKLLMGHLGNIIRLANEGKLVIAGPFLDNQELRGIFIFNVATVEEAQTLIATDPSVKAGLFKVEFHPWYGSAALVQILQMQKNIQQKVITDR
jgi:uncharacterized protein YciI